MKIKLALIETNGVLKKIFGLGWAWFGEININPARFAFKNLKKEKQHARMKMKKNFVVYYLD